MVIILSSGLCLNLPAVWSFMVKPPFILTSTNTLSSFTSKWSCVYFLVVIHCRVKCIYICVSITFISTRCVRGAEVVLGAEAQNREPKSPNGSCRDSTTLILICLNQLSNNIHILWVPCWVSSSFSLTRILKWGTRVLPSTLLRLGKWQESCPVNSFKDPRSSRKVTSGAPSLIHWC